MDNEIIFVVGCLDCMFYSCDFDYDIVKHQNAFCYLLGTNVKHYKINKMPKNCPLRTKNVTIAADLEK